MLRDAVVTALGTMSGTSLDGVDAAVLVTDGVKILDFGPSDYRAYADDERDVLRQHLGLWADDDVSVAAAVVEKAHLSLMREFAGVELAGFHGQTLAHDPGGRGTHQCGDGARLANALGVPVVWDFRSADMRAGGQGAPLAPFYHFALTKWINATAPLAFLNLGGVGNLTWIDPRFADPADPGALLAFDTGPANAPMNDIMSARRNQPFDQGGALAAAGTASDAIVQDFLAHPYFAKAPPKSLDRDDFAPLTKAVAALSDADAMATLMQAVVASVAVGLARCPSLPQQLLVTGGGRKNQTLMQALKTTLECGVEPVEKAGLDGDMIEAQAFAYLAVRSAKGLPISAPGTTGTAAPTTGGRLSQPA
ncbi:anhydro-N-acetylmuramic acid kinase [Cognatiyoonia sp. IB215182]|uniref:anhydro-N-acetylmuramic acid kinase n=1 Tax=Cognatiyoonia sp. IB215182 TaxID=3097353 RepID=UPI002A1409E2|nr:anhydro-N-acetylmuramic acid kinase [Cognatiyoonia sp. IB215182]MDX8353429.1 anhydro-N-acetylmuramic acid kinase [Cognatiyoonia sp. IB215182]